MDWLKNFKPVATFFFTSNHTVNEIKIKKFKAFQNTHWWHALGKLDGISLSYPISLHAFHFT